MRNLVLTAALAGLVLATVLISLPGDRTNCFRPQTAETVSQPLRPGMKSGPPLSDKEFFDSLNFHLPGLEKVASAVVVEDWISAKKAWYEYLKHKFTRAQLYRPAAIELGIPSSRDDHLCLLNLDWYIEQGQRVFNLSTPIANLRALQEEFTRNGNVYFHSTGNLYHFDPSKPFDYLDFDPHGREYHEPLQLYALYDLTLLRDAYFRTDDPIFLKRAVQMVSSYCDWFSGGVRGPLAKESECSEIANPWECWTLPRRLRSLTLFMTFLQKADVDPVLITEVTKVILDEVGLHVGRGPLWRGNWVQFMCADGASIAAIFYEFKESPEWFEDQLDRMISGTDEIFPDGSTADFSTSYSEGWLLGIGAVAAFLNSFESPLRMQIPEWAMEKYERAMDWQLAMRKPDGRDVQFNDSAASLPPRWYGELAGRAFDDFHREDPKWFATGGRVGHPPEWSSFPPFSDTPSYSGMYVMRSDWTGQALYLAVDFGPLGEHAHPDYGSFVLHAFGADLIDEGGCAAYGSEAFENYSRQPQAHNLVWVDGQAQNLEKQARPELGKPVQAWMTNEVFDYAWGSYPFAHLDPSLKGVAHSRRIYFAKPDYFLLWDRMEGSGNHEVRLKLQLSWDVVPELAGASVLARSHKGASLHIFPCDSRSAPRIESGQKEPFWEGWMNKQPHSHMIEPAPAIIYEKRASFPVSLETVLFPNPSRDSPPILVNRILSDYPDEEGVLLEIQPVDRSYRDVLILNPAGQESRFQERSISSAGELVHIRIVRDEVARLAFINTRALALPIGDELTSLAFSKPLHGTLTFPHPPSLCGARIYLDRANSFLTAHVEITQSGRKALLVEVEVGQEKTLEY